jgi:hypothetical protein
MLNRSSALQLAAVTLLILVASDIPSFMLPSMHVAGVLRTILSALLAASVLTVMLAASRWYGWKAAGAVFVIYWGISHFNTLNEAIFFGLDLGPESAASLALKATLSSIVIAAAAPMLMGRWTEGVAADPAPAFTQRSAPAWVGRFALSAITYFVFYFIAGMIIFPFVQEFYAGRPLPGLGEVFIMQLIRGTVYAAIGVVIIRMVAVSRGATALLIGAALSIFGGIAPLLPPNPIMPEHIRNVHMAEVGISNFLFGLALARIMGDRPKPR